MKAYDTGLSILVVAAAAAGADDADNNEDDDDCGSISLRVSLIEDRVVIKGHDCF